MPALKQNQISMKENIINVAVAGTGFGLKVHTPALIDNKKFKLMGLWHPNPEKSKIKSKDLGIKGYASWDELTQDSNLDAVVIATPPEPRYQLAKQALINKKHLLLEKPVALKAEQIVDLKLIATNNNLSVGVDFEYRVVPHFLQLRDLLNDGYIGKPYLIKFDWIMSSRASKERDWNWYCDAKCGGGVVGALGTHAIDMIHWLFGRIKTINSNSFTSINERFDKHSKEFKKVTSDDICLSTFELSTHDNHFVPVQMNLSSVSFCGRGFWIEIYGSEGHILIGSKNQKDYVHGFELWCGKKNEEMRHVSLNKNYIFNKTWEDGRIAPVKGIHNLRAKSIHNQTPMIPGLSEGYQSQKVCELMLQSSKSSMILTNDLP